jgi:hypothetical protein
VDGAGRGIGRARAGEDHAAQRQRTSGK